MQIIIGSTAAKYWFKDYPKNPKDLDILCTQFKETTQKSDIQTHRLAQKIIDLSINKNYLDPDLLYTLKVSHAYWNIFFEKTLKDIEFFKNKGLVINQELHDELVQLWSEIHGKKHVQMQRSTKEFWNDNAKRRVFNVDTKGLHQHEFLHTLVKFKDEPMHFYVRPDKNSVYIPKSSFESLDCQDKLKLATEELLVTAIERFNLDCNSS